MASPTCSYERTAAAEDDTMVAVPSSGSMKARARCAALAVAVCAALMVCSSNINTQHSSIVNFQGSGEAKSMMLPVKDEPQTIELATIDIPTSVLMCEVDINWVILRIAGSVIGIRESTRQCQGPMTTVKKQTDCAFQTTLAIQNIFFVVQLLSSAVLDCGKAVQAKQAFWPAPCVENVFGLLGNLAVLAGHSATVNQTCNAAWAAAHTTTRRVSTTTRRPVTATSTTRATSPTRHPLLPFPTPPGTLSPAAQLIEDNQWRGANCWFAQNMIPLYFIRAALTIKSSVKSCNPDTVAGTQKKCAMDMMSLMGSVFAIAKFVSLAIPFCVQEALRGEPWVKQARCAVDVTGMAGSLGSIVSSLIVMKDKCGPRRLRGDEQLMEDGDATSELEDLMKMSSSDAAQDDAELRSFLQEHFSQEELQREGLWNVSFLS